MHCILWAVILASFLLVTSASNVRVVDESSLKRESHSKWIQQIPAGYLSKLSCDFCYATVLLVGDLLERNKTETEIEDAIIYLCVKANVPNIDYEVCSGTVKEFAPEVIPIIVKIGLNPSEICIDLRLCSNSSSMHKKQIITRRVSLGESKKTTRDNFLKLTPPTDRMLIGDAQDKSNATFRILHLSDIHYDEMYAVGSETNCGEPLCCRNRSSLVNKSTSGKAGKWGDYMCDLNEQLFDSLLERIAQEKVDAIIITGDNTPHDIWMESKEIQISRIDRVYQKILRTFPNTPVFPTIGNHDTFPVDQFSLLSEDKVHLDNFTWLLDNLSIIWGRFLSEDSIKTLKTGGYYSALIMKGLRVISLNTQWADSYNFYLLLREGQEYEEFVWLTNTLLQSERNGERVILIGHIPSGKSAPPNLTYYGSEYVRIINRFSEIIVGQFFGHSHQDEFEIVYSLSNESEPISVIYITSSVTSYTLKNPGFRIYEYNSALELLDYKHYITNLSLANIVDSPTW